MLLATVGFGLQLSWETALILLCVLGFHELGHWVGMWWFGYRDRQILFVPFLGAATMGRKEDATPLQQSIVFLLGPLPGLFLGLGCLWLYPRLFWPVLLPLGIWAVVINYLNLLPIVPLDGGRVVTTLLLRRWPLAQCGFTFLSTLALATFAWWSADTLLGIVAVLSVTACLAQWHWGRAAQHVACALPPQADAMLRTEAIVRTLLQAPFAHLTFNKRLEMAKQLQRHFAASPPALGGTLLLGLLYLLCLGGPVYFGAASLSTAPGFYALSLLQQGHLDAAREQFRILRTHLTLPSAELQRFYDVLAETPPTSESQAVFPRASWELQRHCAHRETVRRLLAAR